MNRKQLVVTLLGVMLVYGLIGFLALPAYVKPRLVASLEESTHRTVRLGSFRVNPFAFSTTLEDFRILDKDSSTLVSLKRVYLRYDMTSLFRHVWGIAQLHVDTPYVAVRVGHNGRLSVSDLLDAPSTEPAAADSKPRALEIGDFNIAGGTIFYQDSSRTVPLTKVIDSLDLALKNFTTVPQKEGTYEFEAVTRQNERLHWRGNISFGPLRSEGLIELAGVRVRTITEFLGDRLRFEAPSGAFSARADYALTSGDTATSFSLRQGRLDVSDLLLMSPDDSLPPVSATWLHAGGIAIDYPRTSITIDTISADQGALRSSYLADGTLTLQQVLSPRSDPADTSKSRATVLIKRLITRNLSFVLTDKQKSPDATIDVSGIDIELANFRYGMPGRADISGRAVLNGGGSLSVGGQISMEPRVIDLTLALEGSPLAALQPWVARYSRAELVEGTFGMRGRFYYADQGKISDIRFKGGLSSDGARITDPVLREDLMRWERLEVRNVDYRTRPASLRISEIAASRPYARVIVGPDRTLNLQHLQAGDSTASAPATAAPPDTLHRSLTTIGKVTISNGSMNFADLSLSPNFDVSILQLQGSITGLSSEQLQRADVDLAGKVDNYAPVTIKGQINPLSDLAYTDVRMNFDGIDLTTFTPYFSKFAGYKIQRGKLMLDLHYKLNKRMLEAENKIVLNQLTLGDKVDSPDATSMPVKLAIALLKDSKGVIDLDIPISGSLDDPEFSIFPIILKVVMNLLWKMVTAPFALLGALFGGSGDEMQYVAFVPGVDSLETDQHARLDALVKGLTDRPALELEVKGASSAGADRNALAEATVRENIQARGTGSLSRQEEKRLLELYRTKFGEDAEKGVPAEGGSGASRDSLIAHHAWQRLVDSVRVPESDLHALAQRRATAILEYLSRRGGIDPNRIFFEAPDAGGTVEESRIRTSMKLTAR